LLTDRAVEVVFELRVKKDFLASLPLSMEICYEQRKSASYEI